MRSELRSVHESVRLLGLTASLRLGLIRLLRDRSVEDRSFDRKHRTDTAGMVPKDALGIDDPLVRAEAVFYVPSPARVTRYLIRQLGIDAAEWAFMDLGAGKGRVLLVASEWPFRRLLGSEISPALVALARENVTRYRGKGNVSRIELRCSDARQVDFPPEDTVLHLYHPFGFYILRAVLRRLEGSLAARPRRLKVLYLAASKNVLDVFAEFPFLRLVRFVPCPEPKYSFALFETSQAGS